MLTFEKLSRHPQTFSRLTGVSTELFREMVEKIRPLWDVVAATLMKAAELTIFRSLKTMFWQC